MDEDDKEDSFKLRRFSGLAEDFSTWRLQFEAALGMKNLDHLLEQGGEGKGGNEEAKQKDPKEHSNFLAQNKRLYNMLMLSLDFKTARHIATRVPKKDGQ